MTGFSSFDKYDNEISIQPPNNLVIYGVKDNTGIISKNEENIEYLYPNLVQADQEKLISLIFDVDRDKINYVFKFEDVIDTVSISYTRKRDFVGVNCGFKTTFHNISIIHSNNKISSAEILSQNIEYDTEQHLKIFLK